ncbi:MAG TPA: VWA domain-containing protein, partial [Actinomycetota bacterium]|nr:VWA domain-containing protein [Actinomycetota bacterium]
MPADARRHVVVLSDGRQTLGDALGGVRLLRSQGVRVDVLPVRVRTGDEARVDEVQVPSTLPAGATTQARVLLNSNVAEPATLSVFLDQTLVSHVPVSLQVGETQVSVAIPAPAAGFHTVRAQLDANRDTYAENNAGQALIQVLGPPRVLVVEGSPGEGANVAAALRAASLNPQVAQPAGMPDTLPALAAYRAVALVDVPASALSTARIQALQSGVRDLGIGLAAFGGASSLGPGGYAGTPLDATLPVTAQIPQQLRKPPVAVVLVLETMESPQADAVMRGAARAVVDQLSPQDYVGVADGASGMLVPLQPATGKARIEQTIGSAQFGDPPSYAPYVDAAAEALATQPNANKHIVVVGDGDATDDYPGLGRAIASRGVNVSAIGINVESQPQFMAQLRSLAQAGGGSFYESDSPSQLPQLLLEEAQKSLKPWIVPGTFTPQLGAPSPALGGTDPLTLPSVDGYVASTPKPAAEVVLRSPSNDPVLATWQYGLGRAVAWTSDTSGRWTAGLLAWPGAGKLLANIVGWTIPLGQDPALSLQATIAGDEGHVAVRLADPPAGVQVVASVAGPDLQGAQVPLSPTAPGRYEGSFPAGQTGSYLVKVTASDQGKEVHTALGGLALAYSAEYRFLGTDLPFLSELARAGGGSILSDGAAAFRVPLPRVAVKTSLAFLLLAVATILLPLDVASRRLVL